MNIEIIENVIVLLAVIFAMLGCLFRYIDTRGKGYLLLCICFLTHLLSDYYWTVYLLVMKDNPDVSEFIAYFGWNLSYLAMLFVVLGTGRREAKRFFHPAMLIPIPLNMYQFMLYIEYGGVFNNLWSGLLSTATAVICIQSIMYHLKKRKEGVHFPYLHTAVLVHVITSYGMWTASCFDWPSAAGDPYYYFELANTVTALLLAWCAAKDYAEEGFTGIEKDSEDIRFQVRMQGAVTFIIFGVCTGGYFLAAWMKNMLPAGTDDPGVYNIIAVTLLVLSLFLVILILVILYVVALRYKTTRQEKQRSADDKRNRFNLVLTLLITLALMVFTVVYNSRLYYNVAASRIYDAGEDKAQTAAAELQNYLYLAESTLKVTADTVEMMVRDGETQEKITRYILDETQNQKSEFDENFTGLYAYVRGQYVDGLGWEPPEGYDPTQRDWHRLAVKAKGRVVIIPPYIDAQTGSAVITICKLLTNDGYEDGNNVVALDVIVNHIQDFTGRIDVGGKGYAMIVNEDGMIIAHRDPDIVGCDLRDELGPDLFTELIEPGNHIRDVLINGEDSTVFTSSVMDQWYVIIVVSDDALLEDTRSQLLVNIFVSFIIFTLISVFYYFGYKNEQAYGKKMEEMKVGRQKQEYEAKVLRLEKHAADEANKAKSSFLADMSHEIRTPINAILGMNEMIIRETGEQEVLEYAKNIKTSGATLLQLVNSILDFSKIEDGKMEIVPVKYKLASLITYLENSIRDRAASKGLDFFVSVSPSLPSELYGDDTRIEQVIVNLLTNAVKYTKEGSVSLTVEERGRRDDRILLYVEVKDTGIGIKEDDMNRLFQSFERLDIIRNRNIEGTGLGISITTNLLNLMGSELEVSSVYGEGSVFSFELWQKIKNPEPVGDYTASASNDDTLHSYRESFTAPDARILIVDDTKVNLIVAVNLLKGTGIKADTAQSGAEAVKLAGENRYDCILLDQRMPGMDGIETLRAIREADGGPNSKTPVICLTADAIRGARERYMAEGFSDYLSKPVDGRELERVLAENLPADKVIRTGDHTGPEKGALTDSDKKTLAALDGKGFDTSSALTYCNRDMDIYVSVLSEFAKEYVRKSENLRRYYDSGSWDDYSILIHSVKSSSASIGAKELSEVAARLEKASDEKDVDAVQKDHDGAMRLYREVTDAIRENINVAPDEDGDILEFNPGGG